MINRLLCFVSIIVIASLVTACSKESGQEKKEGDLNGTWQWIRTDGGIAFHIHDTPNSTGKNIELKITSNRKYYIYTNGSLTSEGTYLLETRKCIHDHTDKIFINFSAPGYDMMVEKVNKDSLELSDEAYDGVGSLYKRKPESGN